MAGPYNLDITDPADNAVVSAFPANERAFRAQVQAYLNTEHDFNTGYHAFQELTTTTKNALSSPPTGMLVYDTTLAVLQINTGTPGAPTWTSIGPIAAANNTPIGTELAWPGLEATVPSNYFLENGQAVSRATYATLFGVLNVSTTGNTNATTTITNIPSTTGWKVGWFVGGINIPAGATISSIDSSSQIHISIAATGSSTSGALVVGPHGIGDGSTTFNVPDRRGRVIAGADDMGGTAAGRLGGGSTGGFTQSVASLGATAGEQKHTQTAAELVAHNHTASSSFTGNAISLFDEGAPTTPGNVAVGVSVSTGDGSFTPSGSVSTTVNSSTGGGNPFNVTQPTGTTNWIIRAL